MKYEWNETKYQRNIKVHGVSFSLASQFDWSKCVEFLDDRADYGETRIIALGVIDLRVYVCVYTDRLSIRRIISLRKANKRETLKFLELSNER